MEWSYQKDELYPNIVKDLSKAQSAIVILLNFDLF